VAGGAPTLRPLDLLPTTYHLPVTSSLQCLADFSQQGFGSEGLLEKGYLRFQYPVIDNRVVGVPGHVDSLCLRP